MSNREHIISRLRREIQSLHGIKPSLKNEELDERIGSIRSSFYNDTFPLSAIHEFICFEEENEAATTSFIATILAPIMKGRGKVVWIGTQKIFAPALKFFGIRPDNILFMNIYKQADILWATEECLKCRSLAAVVCQLPELDFTVSRRLQLAVEQSNVTGFVIRVRPKNINITACVSRWQIHPIPSEAGHGMPGVGFPRWNIELSKVKNGKPGLWQMEFSGNRLTEILPDVHIAIQHKKAV